MDIENRYDISGIFVMPDAVSRSISAENPKGEKAGGATEIPDAESASRELGKGWKVRPCIDLPAGKETVIADITGPGMITHIWMTCSEASYRDYILRIVWDNEETPSVEVPLGDFFASGWCVRTKVISLPINVNPSGGLNSYWPMPFRKSAKISIVNQGTKKENIFFYQIDYVLKEIAADAMYMHAQWRRSNPLAYGQEHTIVDNIIGAGRFAGVYIAWGQNNNGWWGEGEVKFFVDGDDEYPTYCGTGTEDYFGGAWCFIEPSTGEYETYSAPYLGYHQFIKPDGKLIANMRHGMYRWHIIDPIFFYKDFKATIQALGWRSEGRFLPLQDDIASTAFWYQSEPHMKFPTLPDRNFREVI